MDACADILAQDYTTIVGTAECLSLSKDHVSLIYSSDPSGAAPAYLRLGKKNPPDVLYDFVLIEPPAKKDLVPMQQVIAGDFCVKDTSGACTTELLKPNVIKTAYVQEAADSQFRTATVNAISADTLDIRFSVPPNYRPAWVVLVTAGRTYRFAYTPALPLVTEDLIFTSDDMESVCNTVADPDGKNSHPDCMDTKSTDVTLKFISGEAQGPPDFGAIQNRLLIVRWRGLMGHEPGALIVTRADNSRKSIVARRSVNPGGTSPLMNVSPTLMDQITTQRNYGNRIAKRYIAVSLDIQNLTSKKMQFNKSATYFDVDFVEAKERKTEFWQGFKETVKVASTLGMYQPTVYNPPFIPGRADNGPPKVSRFGLEQNVRYSPIDYLSALASFDYTTEKTDEKLRAAELIGSVLSNIATGGLVADRSGAFRAGTSVFAGTFLPGLRALTLDTPAINRLRSNLVAQTMQETVQVQPFGSTSTIVLLPRTGILAFTDMTVPVMVSRVLNAHVVPEVVFPADETAVQKNTCKVGYTKDQARQALGEPTGLTTNSDNTSSFTYSKGSVASVNFDAGGSVIGCSTRSNADQLNSAKTMAEAEQILSQLGLSATKIALTDSSTVLVDIPGIQQTYHFDAKGNRAADYTFLFSEIKTQEGKASKADFDTYLEGKAGLLSADRKTQIQKDADAAAKGKSDAQFTYSSPDIQKGSLTVTFKNADTSKAISAKSVVDHISFVGDKPSSVQ